jgi:NADH-quinone oxidoreductase subunit J
MERKEIIFFAIAALTVASAAVVAFSRNIIRAAFALLGVFAGVAGLYIMLSADFVAVVQFVIYIGGILILILFAVMLTTKIDKISGERKLLNRAMEPLAGLVGVLILGYIMWRAFCGAVWTRRIAEAFLPTTAAIGNKFLNEYLLPFEAVSVLLVLVLVGAVVLGRREVKPLE